MPYTIAWEAKGVIRTFTGSFSKDDLYAAHHEVYGSSRFDELRYIISDYTQSQPDETVTNFVAEISAAIASSASRINPKLWIVGVATDPKHLELLNAFLNAPVTPVPNAKIFPTLAEARQWVES